MGPFSVSSSGASVQSATGPSSLLNIGKPMSKLDTTNLTSFQTISVLFNHEPPQPAIGSFTDTQLYQFKHGYSYIPTMWMAWQNPAPAYPASPSSGNSATTFNTFGDDTASYDTGISSATGLSLFAYVTYNDPTLGVGTFTNAILYVIVDQTNVTIYVRKTSLRATSGGALVPIFLVGVTVKMRIYCFVEPGTTSTY